MTTTTTTATDDELTRVAGRLEQMASQDALRAKLVLHNGAAHVVKLALLSRDAALVQHSAATLRCLLTSSIECRNAMFRLDVLPALQQLLGVAVESHIERAFGDLLSCFAALVDGTDHVASAARRFVATHCMTHVANAGALPVVGNDATRTAALRLIVTLVSVCLSTSSSLWYSFTRPMYICRRPISQLSTLSRRRRPPSCSCAATPCCDCLCCWPSSASRPRRRLQQQPTCW